LLARGWPVDAVLWVIETARILLAGTGRDGQGGSKRAIVRALYVVWSATGWLCTGRAFGEGYGMFIDWCTVSFGRLDEKTTRDTIFNHVRSLGKTYRQIFSMRTFGTFSLCLPGQFWQSINEVDGLGLVDDIRHWASSTRVTRVDFAHDWNLDVIGATPIWWAFGSLPNVTRLEGPAGKTWSVGSRESERFARLYVKSSEIKARTGIDIGFPILRFEFEAKGRCAPEYLDHYRRCPDVVQSDVAKRYNLTQFLDGKSDDIIRVHGAPKVDAFAFIRQFHRAIQKARLEDPVLFDELIKPPCK